MDISAISPWFGSKRTLAESIIEELGDHISYWEPFCGSCAVLLSKPESSHETVNDLHKDLVNLAMVLSSDRAFDLYERVSRTLYSEELFYRTKERWVEEIDPPKSPADVSDEHVKQAYEYMIMAWMGRNGAAGTGRCNYQMAIRWTPGGGSGPIRWESVCESIPAWHKRLRRVCILNKDAFEVISKIDDVEGVCIYVDPPYFKSSRARGGTQYRHEFESRDHQSLSDLLKRFKKARVVLSYYDCEEVRNLYGDWTIREEFMNKNLHVQNLRGATATVAPEILLMNGPSFEEVGKNSGKLFG